MSEKFPPVAEFLPHKPPMVLVDEIVSYEPAKKQIAVAVNISPESAFYDDTLGGVPNLIAIEYMAQASAALAEIAQKQDDPSAAPRPGMLLGTRKLNLLIDKFESGKRYLISSKDVFDDGTTASFECEIKNESAEVVASAALTAYRPENFAVFLEGRTEV
jgi:predicted hotdog family 3-hydroxylacyl-ACP dehydratase